MPPVPFADNFLAGSLLSLLMPVALLIALVVWYTIAVRRVPSDTPESSSRLPGAEVVAAAADAVHEVTPAGRQPPQPQQPRQPPQT
ncbi:MAG: hypothetical protein ACRDNK_02050 [Solirubrobacteraceae bacterium]